MTHACSIVHEARSHRRGAFTLVELLVVVTLIVVLLALLVPAVGKAKEMAKRATCLANLRSMMSSLKAYQANNGLRCFPEISWTNTLQLPTELTTCPSVLGLVQPFPSSPPKMGSFGYNNELLYPGSNQLPLVDSRIQDPVNTFIWADAASPSATGLICDLNTLNPIGSTPQFHGRHLGMGNVAWYDGHASSIAPYIQTANLSSPASTYVPLLVSTHLGQLSNASPSLSQSDFYTRYTTGIQAFKYNYYFWYDKVNHQ